MSTSLGTLLTMTRDHLDESSADRWTQAELRRYINQGVRYVQGQIEGASQSYFLRVETATAAPGVYQLALPTDIWGTKLRALYYYAGSEASGTPYKVQPGALEDIYNNLDQSGTPSKYALHAGFLRWMPMLDTTGCFRFIYSMQETPFATDGSDDTNNLGQIADEHTDVIAMYAALTAKNKVGADTRPIVDMFKTRMEQILFDVQPSDPVRIPQVRID